MELFIFVQELEELVAQNPLVSALVGVDDEILKVFDELQIPAISEMSEHERWKAYRFALTYYRLEYCDCVD